MKASELTGAELDYWVAMAQGMTPWPDKQGYDIHVPIDQSPLRGDSPDLEPLGSSGRSLKFQSVSRVDWRPSTNWAQGGPIIELARVALKPRMSGWKAEIATPSGCIEAVGKTYLVAAMRSYVASKFRDNVYHKI